MADTKISALTDGVTAISTDQIPVARGAGNASITPGYIQTMISAAAVFQPKDTTLTALAGYNTNGLLTQTAADTFAGRTLAGTSNRLTVTNGDGVAGNPTLDISSSYVGQASITTLGTIGTGVWQGTAVAGAYGGTGVANGASATLTLPNAATTITGGGTLALGGFIGTLPATGTFALLGTANVFTTLQEIDRDNIGAVSTGALALVNNTAAAAGAQQWSPRLRLTGQGWKTTATASSQTVDWIIENRPVQGAANPSTTLVIASQINGAGFVDLLTLAPVTTIIAASLEPATHNARNLGSSGNRWADGFFAGNLNTRKVVSVAVVVGDTPLLAKGLAGQTANLQEWQDPSANVFSSISENGYFTTRKNAAPADAELATGELAWWFDSTAGAAFANFKGKNASGTVVTGVVALT